MSVSFQSVLLGQLYAVGCSGTGTASVGSVLEIGEKLTGCPKEWSAYWWLVGGGPEVLDSL